MAWYWWLAIVAVAVPVVGVLVSLFVVGLMAIKALGEFGKSIGRNL